jgi:predicted ATPase/DNA-binding winged helix-turn-helix (wHTH) protein
MEATSSLTRLGPEILALPSSAPWDAVCSRARSDHKPFRNANGKMHVVDRASDPTEDEISFGPFRLLPGRRLLLECDNPVHIGSRALDLLIALVERHGEPVSKSELIAKVWRHTFVDEGNIKVQIAALRRALADGQAGTRYISAVAGHGYCFVAPISRIAATAEHLGQRLTNVPQPLTQLIGRDDLLRTLSAHFARHRLVTLIGPGGIGKTSAAVATAAGLVGNYAHGVWHVDLTSISDPLFLPAAVGSTIRRDVFGKDSSADLFSFLSNKRLLLVLDNCEHIIDATATLALQVLRAAPHVQILATSREALSVEGEQLLHVQPLEFPLASSALRAADALGFTAIQLFVERAANNLGDFRLRDPDTPVVIEICRKLDGIPLAIELAAASLDALGLRGVLARLDDPLQLPAARRRTAASRHRSLRALLDWSYHLLTEEEKRVLRRLSAFPGSFTMKAATAAASEASLVESEVVDRVVALVAKSLVLAAGSGSEIRMRLLATTRAYAFAKLAECGEMDVERSLLARTEAAAKVGHPPD